MGGACVVFACCANLAVAWRTLDFPLHTEHDVDERQATISQSNASELINGDTFPRHDKAQFRAQS